MVEKVVSQKPAKSGYAYQRLASQLREQIRSGQLAQGSRMPSVRGLCGDQGLSKATVISAYSVLEAEGLIEARPRSGFFVCIKTEAKALKAPEQSRPSLMPAPVSADQVLVDIMQRGAAFDLVASHEPNAEGLDNIELRRSLSRAQRRQDYTQQLYYDNPLGLSALRSQLALRIALSGSQVGVDDVLITSGCQHSLLLALMATTEPGDLVALESPGFYGAFQLLENLGLKALELSSDASTGISPEALALALEHWDIKAVMLTPAFATPTGSLMPDDHKRRIIELSEEHDVAIIEDDIYGELAFSEAGRPRSLHSIEQSLFNRSCSESRVFLCSSFSKCLSRDLRLGWIIPGRYSAKVQRLKLVTSLASSQTQQLGLSDYLASGGLSRHLRSLRARLQQQCLQLQSLILKYLPMAVSCSQPVGGLCLWLELPKSIDTLALYAKARDAGIILTPGALFSSQERYQSFLRLSFLHPWTDKRIEALQQLAVMVNAEVD